MKKLLPIFILIAALTFAFTGCGKKQAADQSSTPANAQNGEKQSSRQTPADLIGEVDSISGNDITLKVIAMPQRPSGNQNGEKPTGTPGQKNQGDKQNQGNRPDRQNQGDRQPQYTGEAQTITLSNSIPITTYSRGDNGPKSDPIKLSDIKKGDRLQVYYSDKEKKAIEKVSVMPQRSSTPPTPAAKSE